MVPKRLFRRLEERVGIGGRSSSRGGGRAGGDPGNAANSGSRGDRAGASAARDAAPATFEPATLKVCGVEELPTTPAQLMP